MLIIVFSASIYLGFVKEFDQAPIVGSLQLIDFLAVLIDFKRGHAIDFSFLGALSIGVNIQFLEDELGVFGDKTHKNGPDLLAGSAPSRSEVDNQRFAAACSGCNSF